VNRRPTSEKPRRLRPAQLAGNFSKRFDEIEQKRAALIARLTAMGDKATAHPSHKRARTLLNASFRRASLVQRIAILEAADWLIGLIEMSPMV
jgi:hypothetical protein